MQAGEPKKDDYLISIVCARGANRLVHLVRTAVPQILTESPESLRLDPAHSVATLHQLSRRQPVCHSHSGLV